MTGMGPVGRARGQEPIRVRAADRPPFLAAVDAARAEGAGRVPRDAREREILNTAGALGGNVLRLATSPSLPEIDALVMATDLRELARAADPAAQVQEVAVRLRGLFAEVAPLFSRPYDGGARFALERADLDAERLLVLASGPPGAAIPGAGSPDMRALAGDVANLLEAMGRPPWLVGRDRTPYGAALQGALGQFYAMVVKADAADVPQEIRRTLLELGEMFTGLVEQVPPGGVLDDMLAEASSIAGPDMAVARERLGLDDNIAGLLLDLMRMFSA